MTSLPVGVDGVGFWVGLLVVAYGLGAVAFFKLGPSAVQGERSIARVLVRMVAAAVWPVSTAFMIRDHYRRQR